MEIIRGFVKMYIFSVVAPSTPSLIWNPVGITVAGIPGVANDSSNMLNLPTGVTVDYSNTLYISDWGNNRVQKLLKDASSGTTIAGQANGSYGPSANQLYSPSRILLQSNGYIFVADTNNNRIQFWANGASTGTTVAGSATGKKWNDSTEFDLDVNIIAFH
jgi:hypothetical protein